MTQLTHTIRASLLHYIDEVADIRECDFSGYLNAGIAEKEIRLMVYAYQVLKREPNSEANYLTTLGISLRHQETILGGLEAFKKLCYIDADEQPSAPQRPDIHLLGQCFAYPTSLDELLDISILLLSHRRYVLRSICKASYTLLIRDKETNRELLVRLGVRSTEITKQHDRGICLIEDRKSPRVQTFDTLMKNYHCPALL